MKNKEFVACPLFFSVQSHENQKNIATFAPTNVLSMKTVKYFALALLAIFVQGAQAQSVSSERSYPYAFVGVQGGGQLTFTNYDHTKLITPVGAFQVGAQWTPIVGTRLHVSGISGKLGLRNVGEFKYKYATTDFDVMLNVANMLRSNHEDRCFDLYLIGGFGLNYNWDYDRVYFSRPENHFSHNFRAGILADYNLTRRLSIGLEVDANNLADRFNGKLNGENDWQLTAMLGLT